jgi:hypothetical protein
MESVFGSGGDHVHGPSGEYSGGGFGGFASENPTNVVDPPQGSRFDPGPQVTPPKPTSGTAAGTGSEAPPTWPQRVLQLLARLQTAKGFQDLPPKLRNEVSAPIADAPEDARSS